MHDEHYMCEALQQAKLAAAHNEVPVGAVVVLNGEIIARAFNHPIASHDPTAHAEIAALRQAARWCGNYRLPHCEMYVTLEPCMMCLGAMIHARIKRIVFGAKDFKTGVCGSAINLMDNPSLNHRVEVIDGVLASESTELLQQFFLRRRMEAKARRQHERMQKNSE